MHFLFCRACSADVCAVKLHGYSCTDEPAGTPFQIVRSIRQFTCDCRTRCESELNMHSFADTSGGLRYVRSVKAPGRRARCGRNAGRS